VPHQVEFTPAARRQFRKLPAEAQQRLAPAIEALAAEPLPSGAKKLVGAAELWRIRVGDYRLIYTLEAERLVVLVVRVGHRRDVYDGRSP